MSTKRKLSIFITLIFAFSILSSSFAVNADSSRPDKYSGKPYKAGEIIVKFKDDVQARQMNSFTSGKGLKLKKSLKNDEIKVYGLRNGMSVDSAIKSLMRSDLVEYAQPNYIYRPLSVPNDKRYNELWGLNNVGQKILGQAGVEDTDINAPEAWDITQGREDIVVAVIDEGIYIDHPDLQNNIWVNTGEIPGNGIDDDDNGYIDDVNGWDFYNNDKTVFDELDGDSHGTHVAGTIAASADSKGVLGVASNVKIMPLKFLGPLGGSTLDAIAAIEYAVENGADVVNCSWGGEPGESEDPLLKYYIETSGLLFVVAAGNEANDNDSSPVYPAYFDCDNIITIAAVDSKGNKPDFSNYGAASVDVGAPGLGILSTMPSIGGTAAITVTSAVYDSYKAFYSSLDIGDFIIEEEKSDFVKKVVDYNVMNISKSNKILAVDDDETDVEGLDKCKAYLEILASLGFTNITEVDVVADVNGPSYESMKAFDDVIWLTGNACGKPKQGITTLTDTDQDNIIRYLQDNKKFLLIGEDSLYGIEDSSLFKEYFKIDGYLEYGINDFAKWRDDLFEEVLYNIEFNDFRDIITYTSEDVESVMEYIPMPYPYYYKSGTSMAAPHVSGIAALLLSKNPDLTPSQIKAAIMATAKPLDSLTGKTVTGGMADAFEALKKIAPEKPSNLKAAKSGSNVTLTWNGIKSGDFKEYIIERKIGSGSYTELSRTPDNSFTNSGIDIYTTYSYRIKAVDSWGNISSISNEAVVYAYTPPSSGSGGSGGSSGGGGGGGGGFSSTVSTTSAETKPTDSVDSDINKQLSNTLDIVYVKASIKNDVESASISFDNMSKLTKSKKKLNIRGNDVIFEIPSGAFDTVELKDYLSSRSAIWNIKAQRLNPEELKELLVFEFTASAKDGSKNKNIESFNKKIKVSIKLSSKEVDKYGRNKLGVYRFDEKAQKWDYVGGIYDSSNGMLVFMTDHFSKYAVMAYTKDFDDIKGHWAKDDIDILISKHIAEGRNDKFEPNEDINRAELVKMLVKMLMIAPDRDIKLSDGVSIPFKDVSALGEDLLYIDTTVKEGIIKGFDDGTFRPDKPVSREEMASMIARIMKFKTDYDILETSFNDKELISAWAAKDVAAVYENGIITGDSEGNFSGKRSVTRVEAAVMVKRMMESMGLLDIPSIITGKLVISTIEGTHYELETNDGIYVLIADEKDREINRMLSSMVRKEIMVKGYLQSGFNIYQRGKLFKVISIFSRP